MSFTTTKANLQLIGCFSVFFAHAHKPKFTVIPSQIIQGLPGSERKRSHPSSHLHSRVSRTIPLSETHYEAMDFALWRTIGNQVLIKSNINNWIACKEGSGSRMRQKVGSLSCKLVKQFSQQCAGVVPTSFVLNSYGPYLSSTSLYYRILAVIQATIFPHIIHVVKTKQISHQCS